MKRNLHVSTLWMIGLDIVRVQISSANIHLEFQKPWIFKWIVSIVSLLPAA